MPYDFDTPLKLRGTHASKWDQYLNIIPKAHRPVNPTDVIPMWVADMDFPAAPAIRKAIAAEAERGYFGYFGNAAPVTEAVTSWMKSAHGWDIQGDSVRYTNGVVAGFVLTVSAFSNPGDGVILFSPVYHTFYSRLRALNREIVESPLQLVDGEFRMDLDTLEQSLTGNEKMVVLCSPHNPGGRLWSGEEIRALAAFCARNDLLLISDEIHMDLPYPGAQHIPTALGAPDCLDRLIVLTAASKGFNTAGGETGIAIVPDDGPRAKFDRALAEIGSTPNRFGMLMTKAAFTEGADWSAAVRAYLADNFALWRSRIGALPGISVMDMSATYLSWVDFSDTGMNKSEIMHRISAEARIAASPGSAFGTGGENCNRFNIAMPRPLLIEAIERLEAAFADLQ